MCPFLETLKTQRWDDHRYYHHSLINQSLHLFSAISFLCVYVLLFWDPAIAALIAWMIAMTSRQIGHFFFEPKGYDEINQATHQYKESVKVGYNLRRKFALHVIWGLTPLVLYFEPTLFGLMRPWDGVSGFFHNLGLIWLFLGMGGLLFRCVQLWVIEDVQTGLAWAVKIVTDPFHDIRLYYKAPVRLMRVGLAHELALRHAR
jgi:hypothetical protein